MLVEAGLLLHPILYMSRSIIATKAEYYRLLQAVTRDNAWEDWIAYMLRMVRLTADETISKIDDIRELQDEFHERVRTAAPVANNADFLAVLFEQPYCRIRNVIERCGVSRPTAAAWLRALADRHLLLELKAGREKLFINTRFLEVLTRKGPIITEPLEPVLF